MQFTGEGQEGEAVLELFSLCVRCVRMWGLSGASRTHSLGAFLPQKARAFLPLLYYLSVSWHGEPQAHPAPFYALCW